MNLTRTILVFSICFCSINSTFAENSARVMYTDPENAKESAIKKELETSSIIDSIVTLINENFLLLEPLDVVYGGEDGPLYDSEENKILIPYSFIDEVKIRFIAAKYSDTGVSEENATMDALMHTLFHEFAHALITMYDLPVTGKEEDAADSLATVLIINFFEDGQEIAISAADLFDLESEEIQVLEEEDFWDEHSLDAQRFYSTLCYVYGSNPDDYAYLLEDLGFSEERAELCIVDYENISRSWLVLLEPYTKHNKNNSADASNRAAD